MKQALNFIFRFLMFFWLITFFITLFLLGLRWLTVNKYQVISEDLRLWEFYLPVLLSFCSVVLLVRPRFRERYNSIYTYERDNWTKHGYALQLSMMFLVSFMLLTYSQEYFSGTHGDLITIKSLDEISDYPRERFFKIDSIAYNPYYGAFFENNSRPLPSRNPKIATNHYIVNPLHDSRIKYYKPPLTHWMALHSRKLISTSRLRPYFTSSTPEEDIKKQSRKVYDQIDTYDISLVKFYYRTPSSALLDSYKEVIASRYGEKIARKAIVLEPKRFPFEERASHVTSPFRVFMISFPMLIILLLVPYLGNLKK